MDNVITGIQTAWTGKHHSTSLYHMVNALGEKTGLYGPQGASYIEMALNIGSTVNPRTLTFAYRCGMGAPKGRARNNFNISHRLNSLSLTPAYKQIESFSTPSAFDSALYPKEKLSCLVNYLDRRGVKVYSISSTIDGNPRFVAMYDGAGKIYLPENPTDLQVKHKLSHYLDFKKLGVHEYVKLSRYERENLVLERLKNNRVWTSLNDLEKEFSINCVDGLKPKGNIVRNGYE